MNTDKRASVCCFSASDSSGHSGIQADLRTLSDLDIHGCSVITAITAQNSQQVDAVYTSTIESINGQWQSVSADITPVVCKIGLLVNPQQLSTVADIISNTQGSSKHFWIADPVLKSSTGVNFHAASIIADYKKLLPCLDLLTPNIPEAEALLQRSIKSSIDIEMAAQELVDLGVSAVLIKGGHSESVDQHQYYQYSRDFFYSKQQQFWLSSPRQLAANTRGTGCVMASAIAAFIAHGKNCRDAVVLAHAYIQQGIRHGYAVGHNAGPIGNVGWPSQLDVYPAVSHHAAYQSPIEFARCDSFELGLYPVIDSLDWLQKLLSAGVRTIQLRIKNLQGEQLSKTLVKAIALGRKYQAHLFINDHWALAIQHHAYGVHLGQEDINSANIEALREAGLRLGISTHSEYEWARAAALKPSYIALGAVFATNTKPAKVIGLENLKQWVAVLQQRFPVTAIGGIHFYNIKDVLATGVNSIALVTAITEADNYLHATRQLLDLVETENEL